MPTTIASTDQAVGPMVTLTVRAPRAMPGQTRVPNRSRAATEMPVGGHRA